MPGCLCCAEVSLLCVDRPFGGAWIVAFRMVSLGKFADAMLLEVERVGCGRAGTGLGGWTNGVELRRDGMGEKSEMTMYGRGRGRGVFYTAAQPSADLMLMGIITIMVIHTSVVTIAVCLCCRRPLSWATSIERGTSTQCSQTPQIASTCYLHASIRQTPISHLSEPHTRRTNTPSAVEPLRLHASKDHPFTMSPRANKATAPRAR
jgi:hypothetical protein